MTTNTAATTPELDVEARANRLRHGLVFVASAVLTYGAVEDRNISLGIIGFLFLIASSIQLFGKPDLKASKLVTLFMRHSRRIKAVMFAGAGALLWSAVDQQQVFASVGAALLLAAVAFDLFRKKA